MIFKKRGKMEKKEFFLFIVSLMFVVSSVGVYASAEWYYGGSGQSVNPEHHSIEDGKLEWGYKRSVGLLQEEIDGVPVDATYLTNNNALKNLVYYGGGRGPVVIQRGYTCGEHSIIHSTE